MIQKYRAFIKAEKRMVEVDAINFDFKEIRYNTRPPTDEEKKRVDAKYLAEKALFDDIVLMLGVEIKQKWVFEGDIVKTYFTADSTHSHTLKVVFYNGIFRADNNKGWELETYDEFEVIGNIYEHPHLLEG